MDDHEPQILFAGHTCLDIIPNMSNVDEGFAVFAPNRLVMVDGVRFSTGGSVLNTGLATYRLGTSVRLSLHIGSDPYGQILQSLVQKRVCDEQLAFHTNDTCEVNLVKHTDVNTSFTLVLNPKGTDRMFVCYEGTNAVFVATDVTEDLLDGIKLFHFGYPPLLRQIYKDGGSSLASLFARVQNRGILTCLDTAMPNSQGDADIVDWPAFFKRVLPYVDIFMPSIEEVMYMMYPERYETLQVTGFMNSLTQEDITELAQTFIDMGAHVVGLKLGDQGLYLRTGLVFTYDSRKIDDETRDKQANWNYRQLYIPCFSVQVAGTTGAGDSTIAGFLSGFVRELMIEECMVQAVATGACSVEQLDATSGILPWLALQERLNNGWVQWQAQIPLMKWQVKGKVFVGPADKNV